MDVNTLFILLGELLDCGVCCPWKFLKTKSSNVFKNNLEKYWRKGIRQQDDWCWMEREDMWACILLWTGCGKPYMFFVILSRAWMVQSLGQGCGQPCLFKKGMYLLMLVTFPARILMFAWGLFGESWDMRNRQRWLNKSRNRQRWLRRSVNSFS